MAPFLIIMDILIATYSLNIQIHMFIFMFCSSLELSSPKKQWILFYYQFRPMKLDLPFLTQNCEK